MIKNNRPGYRLEWTRNGDDYSHEDFSDGGAAFDAGRLRLLEGALDVNVSRIGGSVLGACSSWPVTLDGEDVDVAREARDDLARAASSARMRTGIDLVTAALFSRATR